MKKIICDRCGKEGEEYMLIIAALGELFILIVSLAIIFIKWHRMEQRYKNKEKGGKINE
jgi:hypothetical protein